MSVDAEERASNNSKFSSRRKIRESRRNDTAHDHSPLAGPYRSPRSAAQADFWNPTGSIAVTVGIKRAFQ
jgi:hypothetical protein